MRVGIVGSGSMGQAHAPGWAATGAEVVGVTSASRTSGELLASQYGWRYFESLDGLLPEVDVIDLCVPTHLHYEMVVKAARAGKHIMCEKPIALTVADGRAMIAACQTAGVRLFIGMILHFIPEYIAAKQSVRSGQIGNIGVLRLTRASYRPKKPADNWFLDTSKSGGMIIDLMIHDFEFARALAGDVERVFARSLTAHHPDIPEDHVLAILRFRSGAIAHIEGSWAYPVPMFNTRIEVAGDAGLIEFDSASTMPLQMHLHHAQGEASDVALPATLLHESPFVAEVKHFWDALRSGSPFVVTPQDALMGLQIALAAQESTRTGKPVTLNLSEVA